MKTGLSEGFTLLELMIVINILAITGAMVIPVLQDKRRVVNESSAISTLETLKPAQDRFLLEDLDGDGKADYASSLGELASEGLVDNVLTGGQKSGYAFDLETHDPCPPGCWTTFALPANEEVGAYEFFIDDTGIVRFATRSVGPDDPQVTEEPLPDPPSRGNEQLPFSQVALASIRRLSELSPDPQAVFDEAERILSQTGNIERVLDEIDRNEDDHLSWFEVGYTDLLARTRSLKTSLYGLPRETLPIGDDAELRKVLRAYQEKLFKAANFHLTETALPKVQSVDLPGDPVELIEQAR